MDEARFSYRTSDCILKIICVYFWSRDFQPIRCVEKCALNRVKYT